MVVFRYTVTRIGAGIGDDMANQKNDLISWLGLRQPFKFAVARPLGRFLGALLVLLAGALVVIVIVATGHLLQALFTGNHQAIRGVGYLLIAALGAPFLAWRTTVAARQADLQGQALFNDKINAATEELAARKQVTRVIKNEDGTETVLTEWADDLVRRAAAIDRLEGLAQEKPDEAIRIARLLSIYVKELSREHPAKPVPEDLSPEDLRLWVQNLKVERPDMERAVQSLSRLNTQIRSQSNDPSTKIVDLRDTNLQGFDLDGLDLQNAVLAGAQMQGADLNHTQMQEADLSLAQMQGAHLNHAQMQGAGLHHAQMQGADLRWVEMDEETNFTPSSLRGAALWRATYPRDQNVVNQAFGDASALLPNMNRPANWPDISLFSPAFRTEWRAWQALGPDRYDWEDRRKYYTDNGKFSGSDRPPKAQGNWMAEEDG